MQSSAVFCKAHEGAERSSPESLLPDCMTCHKNFGSHTSGGAPIESPLGCMAIPPSSQPTSELMKTCASHTLRLTVRTAPQCAQGSEGCVRMLDAQRVPRAAVRVSPVPKRMGLAVALVPSVLRIHSHRISFQGATAACFTRRQCSVLGLVLRVACHERKLVRKAA